MALPMLSRAVPHITAIPNMITSILSTITPVTVPDSGSAGILLGLGVLTLGVVARFIKNRKR